MTNQTRTDDQLTKKPVSQAQIDANRRNAQKSTGPRSQAGKMRSRGNALTHGAYASIEQVIAFGPFTEDDDEIENFLTSVVHALSPRDVIEYEQARKISKIMLSDRRLDAYETALLQQDGRDSISATRSRGSTAEAEQYNLLILSHMATWNEARTTTSPQTGSDQQAEDTTPFEHMARFLRATKSCPTKVTDLWDDSTTPQSPERWRRAFEAIVRAKYPDPDQFAAWIHEAQLDSLSKRLAAEHHSQANAAGRSLATIERTFTAKGRLSRDLDRAMIYYSLLRLRELPSAETNEGEPA